MKHLFLLLALISSFLLAPNAHLALAAKPALIHSDASAIEEYSKKLQIISEAAAQTFGVPEISIGGGTARSLIQTLLMGQKLEFRDFDIVVATGRAVTAEQAENFARILEQRGLGQFSKENLRPRPRFNPDLPKEQALQYNAGFGFFVLDAKGTEFDVTLFHSQKDMELNGLMDVDTFRIVIGKDKSLAELARQPELFKSALQDPFQALDKILRPGLKPQIIRWNDIEREPGNSTIRVVRSLAKFNALPLDEITEARIRRIFLESSSVPPLQVARNLLKLLKDPDWQIELAAVSKAGVFQKVFSSFAGLRPMGGADAFTFETRVEWLLSNASITDSLQFLKILSDIEPKLVGTQLAKLIKNKNLKVGYASGEFAPFHKGHLGMVKTPVEQGLLDVVFVLPTPFATNDPKTPAFSPEEYSERIQFVKAGTRRESQIWAWPQLFAGPLQPTLQEALNTLTDYLKPAQPLTHVFGMDSYHRVLARGLIEKDRRNRIVVTRPGVPIPATPAGANVKILTNINSEPISATRILHSLAITGESADISPEVADVVKRTPRYQSTLEKARQSHLNAKDSIAAMPSLKGKTLIWHPVENHAGLYDPRVPRFHSFHHQALTELARMGAENLIVYIPANEFDTRISWMREQWKYKSLRISIATDYSRIPDQDRVMVVHSGMVNEQATSPYFQTKFRRAKGLIVFETPDQPLSPLISSISQVRRLIIEDPRTGSVMCQRVHGT